MIKGHYCTKIHNCYMGALCQDLSFVHLLRVAMMLFCKQRRRGTTTQLIKHFFTEKNNESNNVIPFALGKSDRILNSPG